MLKYPPRSETDNRRILSYVKSVFESKLVDAQRKRLNVKVPQSAAIYTADGNRAYHFKPEFFIQTSGCTEFNCPSEKFLLRNPEVCIMPKGVPHGEIASDDPGKFENIVVCFYSQTTTVHVAQMDSEGKPVASDVFFFQTEYFEDMVMLLNRCASLSDSSLTASKDAANGLIVGFFALIINMMDSDIEIVSDESQRVYNCRWLIRHHLSDPELTVKWLAENLDCSPNYLSKIFNDEMGYKLKEYIIAHRMTNAMDILRTTTLSIKEVSTACGFSDPNYFSRLFKQRMNSTAQEFRASANLPGKDTEPKVVYQDRDEYHFGYDKDHVEIAGE